MVHCRGVLAVPAPVRRTSFCPTASSAYSCAAKLLGQNIGGREQLLFGVSDRNEEAQARLIDLEIPLGLLDSSSPFCLRLERVCVYSARVAKKVEMVFPMAVPICLNVGCCNDEKRWSVPMFQDPVAFVIASPDDKETQ